MRTMVVMMLAAAVLGGCKAAPSGQSPVTEAQALKVAEQVEASFTTGDAGAVMKQYADDAVMIDASAPDPTRDRKVATGWTRAFISMKPENYEVAQRHIQLIGPDAFVSSGIARFTVAAGAARPTVSVRFSDVFQRKGDGGWKIVHEHISMPPTPAGKP